LATVSKVIGVPAASETRHGWTYVSKVICGVCCVEVAYHRLGCQDDAAGSALRAGAVAGRAGMRLLENRARATLTAG
jgi:hypothetical protein